MKKKILYLLCGIPGSGKTHWASSQADETHIWVSRDAVRFSMLKPDEDYFAHETEVYHKWIELIREALDNPFVEAVFADATHITEFSRKKTLNSLRPLGGNVQIIPVVFNTPYETCYYRNKERTGRARVPNRVMWQMNKDWDPPSTKNYPIIKIVDYKQTIKDEEKYLHQAL